MEEKVSSDIPLQPVPIVFGCGIAQMTEQTSGEQEQYVMVRFSTALGAQHYLLDGGSAARLASVIGQNARQVIAWDHAHKGPRLIIPGNGDGS